jgi:hypothetical protein
MKKCTPALFVIFMVMLMTGSAGIVSAQGWQWARGAEGGLDEGYYCAIDGAGSLYANGDFSAATSFGTYSLTGTGSYVVKYDSAGSVKWAIETNAVMNTTGSFGLATDPFGNEYLLGYHTVDLFFNGYGISAPGTGKWWYYLAKIDSAGVVQWLENIGNLGASSGITAGNCITTDETGNVYITCPYTGTATIDGYVLDSAGYGDLFVGKFNPSGNAIWVKTYREPHGTVVTSGITVTPTHKIYISGYFDGDSLLFGTDNLVDTGTHANYTGYLAKLDTGGNTLWAKGTGGSSGGDEFTGVVTNSNEDVYLTGFYVSCVLHLAPDTLPQPPVGSYGFLAKYDSAGGQTWVKLMRGQGVSAWEPALDSCGNVWVSATLDVEGACVDTIDGHILTSTEADGDPMFIAGWTSSGTYLEGAVLASGGDDLNSLVIDRRGNIFVEADYHTPQLIVAGDTLTLTSMETNFVAKYAPFSGCGISAGLITGDSILCKGGTMALDAVPAGGTWSSSNVVVAKVGSVTGVVTGIDPGVAVITYTASGVFATRTVTVILTPSHIVGPSDLCLWPTALSDATPGGLWSSSNPGVATIGSGTGIVTGVSLGTVTITYAISASCFATATDTVIVCEAGVQAVTASDNKIELFPNPASTQLTITTSGQIRSVVITNLLGQTVYSSQSPVGSLQASVDISALPSGVYFVKVNGAELRKFVKE